MHDVGTCSVDSSGARAAGRGSYSACLADPAGVVRPPAKVHNPKTRMEVLHWDARIFYFHDLLTEVSPPLSNLVPKSRPNYYYILRLC